MKDRCRDCKRYVEIPRGNYNSCDDCKAIRTAMVGRLCAGEDKEKLMREMRKQFRDVAAKAAVG